MILANAYNSKNKVIIKSSKNGLMDEGSNAGNTFLS